MIFSWNKNCPLSDPDVVSNNTDGNTYDCMKGIVDLNGFRGPNKVNKDIIKFGANGVIANGKGDGCLFKTSKNKCLISPPNDYKPATKEECIAMANSGYGNNKNYCGESTDYWAGAVRACGGKSKMASKNDLSELGFQIYGTKYNLSGYNQLNPNLSSQVLKEYALKLNLVVRSNKNVPYYINLFSPEEYSDLYYNGFTFATTYTTFGGAYPRSASNSQVLCVSD